MVAPVVTIGKAAVTKLNTGTWTQAFTAVYGYMHDKTLEALSSQAVLVTPSEVAIEAFTEKADDETYGIQIVIAKQIDMASLTTQMDAQLTLADEIFRFMRYWQDATTGCDVVACEWEPLYDGARLREQGMFLAVIKLNVRYTK